MAPFKSSLAKSAGKLFGVFRQADLSLRGATQNTRFIPPPPFSATGGNAVLTPGNGSKYHIFTAPGSFVTLNEPKNVEYLLVAGGGAGGSANSSSRSGGGGGGAGGVLTGNTSVTGVESGPTTYPIVIGDGGAFTGTSGTADGNDSTWNSLTAIAGGGGGAGTFSDGTPQNGRPGGSGGGGAESPTGSKPGGTGTAGPPRQGYNGGTGGTYSSNAGSGGGAGAAGAENAAGGIGVVAFSGDTGIPSSYGTSGPSAGRWFGGGGGALDYFKGTQTAGGVGGGGPGGNNATVNTGGGGGSSNPAAPNGGAGGSGILIIKYPN